MNAVELLKLKDGMLVTDFQGKIEKVFPQKDNSYKYQGKDIKGKKQNLVISGALFEVKDRGEFTEDIKGQSVEILSTYNEKRKEWYGMKKSSYKDKEGKDVIKVTVTPSADIQFGGGVKTTTNAVKPTIPQKVDKSVWDKKDLMIAKQSCLKVAAEFSKGRDNIKSPTEITEIAEIFRQYVYGEGYPDDIQALKELKSAENCENMGDDEEIPF